jgi:hypothetical protein
MPRASKAKVTRPRRPARARQAAAAPSVSLAPPVSRWKKGRRATLTMFKRS